jgi:hypothetical protein
MATTRTGKMARIFLPLVFLLSGCSSPHTPVQPLPPLASNSARLIMFRPYNFISMGYDGFVSVNNTAGCSLPNGQGFVTDVPPGGVVITATMSAPGQTDPSRMWLVVVAGQSYYIKFMPGGLLGTLTELQAHGQSGPFNIVQSGPADLGKIKPGYC